MINKIMLLGRLTKMPEIRTTTSGKECCRFSIAQNRKLPDGTQESDYYNCIAWNDSARNIAKYFSVGDSIAVIGSLRLSKYKTQHADNAISHIINVTEWTFAGSSKKTNENEHVNSADEPEISLSADEDDLPF